MTRDANRHRNGRPVGIRTSLAATLASLIGLSLAVLAPVVPAHAADLPGGRYVFVAQTDDQVVALVRGTATVADTVTVPGVTTSPFADMVTGPGNTAVYVLTGTSVTILDAWALTVLGSLVDPSGSSLEGFALSPDGSRVYALTADRHVDVFDVPARSLLGRVAVPGSSTGAARQIVADNTAAYVLAGQTLAVVLKTGVLSTSSIPVAGGGTSMAIYPPTGRIYVTQPAAADQSLLAVVDIASRTVVDGFGVFDPIGTSAPAVSPDGQMIYVGGATLGLFLQRIETLGGGNLSSAAFRAPLGIPVVTPDNVTVYAAPRGTTDLLAVTDWRQGDVFAIPGNPVAVTMVDRIIPPGAPTVTSLANGAGQVIVGFTPGTPGTNPTTGYRVTATDITDPTRGGQTATGTGSPITVPGLTNGDGYTFTVTTLTAGGNSAPSAPSNALTVGIPPTLSGTLPAGKVGVPYSYQLTATGVPAPTVDLNAGTPLPDGLTFDVPTLTIKGTPTVAGSTFLDFTATSPLGTVFLTPNLDIDRVPIGEPSPTTPPPSPTATPTPSGSTTTSTGIAAPGSSAAVATGSLATTGMPVGTFVLLAAVLLLSGTGLLVATRFRRRPHNARAGR